MTRVAMKSKAKPKKISQTLEDKVFDIVVNILVIFAAVVTLYPLYFVVLASISCFASIHRNAFLGPR